MVTNFINLEGNILLFIQEYLRTPFLTPIFKIITYLGNNGAIWIMITMALLCFKKTRKSGILAVVALLCAFLIDNVILKNVIARTRPYEVIDGLQILIQKQKDYSFPSGHTGSSFAAAIIFFQTLPKKYGISAIVLASLIGISRLYVGVHYPSDVICGFLIGMIIGIVVNRLYEYIEANTTIKTFEKIT